MKKAILGLLFVFITVFIGLLFYLELYGKQLFLLALNNAFKRPVSVARIQYQFPLGLKAEKLHVEGLADAASLEVQIAVQSIFEKKIHFSNVKINRPVIIVERMTHEQVSSNPSPGAGGEEGAVVQPPVVKAKTASTSKSVITQIDRLVIKQGQLTYHDGDMAFQLEDVDLKAHQLILPMESVKTDFHLKARIIKDNMPFSGGEVDGQGWFNLVKKDMEAKLKISHPHGPIQVAADFLSQNNNMTVKGNLSLGQYKKSPKTVPQASQDTPVQQAFSYALSSMGFGINAQFSFETKMDNFQVTNISFSGDVVQ